MINFKEIPKANSANGDQDRFEEFAQEFLRVHYRVVKPVSRGADGGVDLLVEESVGADNSSVFKWLVSCKHLVHSARSVGPDVEKNIFDRLTLNRCDGFMIFYSTIVSSGLRNSLELLKERSPVEEYTPSRIDAIIKSDERYERIFQTYFSTSYNEWIANGGVYNSEMAEKVPSFEEITDCSEISYDANWFYDGGIPSFADLNSDLDFKRDCLVRTERLLFGVKNLIQNESNEFSVALLIGAGGTGKTTTLLKLGLELRDQDVRIFRLSQFWRFQKIGLVDQLMFLKRKVNQKLVFLIDDFSELIESEVLSLKFLQERFNNHKAVFVLTDAPNRLEGYLPSLKVMMKSESLIKDSIHQLSSEECERLADKLSELEDAGFLKIKHLKLTREERVKLCEDSSRRHLVVALLQIRNGRKFTTIIIDELIKVKKKESRLAYKLICVFEFFKTPMRMSVLSDVCYNSEIELCTELRLGLKGLVQLQDDYLFSRHPIISSEVYKYVIGSNEIVALISEVLSKIRLTDDANLEFVKSLLNNIVFRTLLVQNIKGNDLKYKKVEKGFLYIYGEAHENSMKMDVYTFLGSINMRLKFFDRAYSYFDMVLKEYDADHAYSLSQLAWIKHHFKKWESAASFARRAAFNAPENASIQFQMARILSLNTFKNFQDAEKYFEAALDIDRGNSQFNRSYENYKSALLSTEYLSSLDDDDFLPSYLLKELRPGVMFTRAYFGLQSKEYKVELFNFFIRLQSNPNDRSIEFDEELANDVIEKDKKLKAKYLCALGRELYLRWLHFEHQDSKLVFKHLTDSINLNDKDPFTHCWLGTYYKEVEKNLPEAEKEYRLAVMLSAKSEFFTEKNHPLFTHNLGLFIYDKVKLFGYSGDILVEAISLFQTAKKKNEDFNWGFHWPEYYLDELK